MHHCHPTILLLSTLLLSPLSGRAEDPTPFWTSPCRAAARLAAGDQRLALVEAEVTSVEEDGNFQTAKVKVTRVFSGPKDLTGSVLTDKAIEQGSDFGVLAVPKYAAGEVLICTLILGQESGWRIRGRWRGAKAELEPVREWATQVTELTKLADSARWRAVRDLCRHRNDWIATFAVRVICDELADEVDRRAAASFLTDLPNDPFVGIAATLEADWRLQSFPGWSDSQTRERFFRRWTGLLSHSEARQVLGYLRGPHGLSNDRSARLMGDVLYGPGDRPKSLRRYAVESITTNADTERVNYSAVFDQLVRVLKADPDADVRRSAAIRIAGIRTIRSGKPGVPSPTYSDEQRNTLRELLKTESDPKAIQALRRAIDDGPSKP